MTMEPLKVRAELGSLKAIREYVRAAAVQAGIDKKRAYKLQLAVDEIATNIAVYGYKKAGFVGDILVMVEITPASLKIILEDSAVSFDPLKHPVPEDLEKLIQDRSIGGLGVFLALHSVDQFLYEYVDGHNRNIFVLHLDEHSS
jgi:serine/threonine-protein kinase RsbW